MRAPVRARAERAWGHGERVVAVPQHATRRCGGCAGMVWRWARERERESAGGFSREACKLLRKGAERSEANRTENSLARRHPHHASGSFICRESSSVYSRVMATPN